MLLVKKDDFDAGWLRLNPGESKNRERREFPLTPGLRVLLEAQRERVRTLKHEKGQVIPWLFPNAKGDRLLDIRHWKRACRAIGYQTA